MHSFKTVLFDLDGTLIDTTPLIMESFKHTFLYHFNEKKEDKEIIKFLGIPLKKPFEDLYPDMVEILLKTYKEFNEMRHDSYVGVFIGMIETLKRLKDRGILLGVVTSKRRELAYRGMRLFGIDAFMSVIVCMEDTPVHKPQGDPILKALEIAEIRDKSEVLYVGDSPYDILCARNAGVKSAAVRWSYVPEEELDEYGPDLYLEKPEELLRYV